MPSHTKPRKETKVETILNVTSRKLQKTEKQEVRVIVNGSRPYASTPSIVFKGEDLIGYILLTPEIVREIVKIAGEKACL